MATYHVPIRLHGRRARTKPAIAVLPGDARLIMCKRAIRFLRDKPRWAEVDNRGRALIGADYLEERCNMPELAESIRIMVRDATTGSSQGAAGDESCSNA
jgi:hypothetical protein